MKMHETQSLVTHTVAPEVEDNGTCMFANMG